jgi:hypothetical protein
MKRAVPVVIITNGNEKRHRTHGWCRPSEGCPISPKYMSKGTTVRLEQPENFSTVKPETRKEQQDKGPQDVSQPQAGGGDVIEKDALKLSCKVKYDMEPGISNILPTDEPSWTEAAASPYHSTFCDGRQGCCPCVVLALSLPLGSGPGEAVEVGVAVPRLGTAPA